jgi:hypothetical protein
MLISSQKEESKGMGTTISLFWVSKRSFRKIVSIHEKNEPSLTHP